jgi:hypothetical protein
VDRLDIIEQADAAGYSLVPVEKDSKVSLTRWNTRTFSTEELLAHVRRGGNVAAKVGPTRDGTRALVIDRDTRDAATWRILQAHGLHRANMQTETASGNWHLWLRLGKEVADLSSRIRIVVEGAKVPIDAKATGYVLLPGSRVGGKEYRFRDGKGLKRPEELMPLPDSFLELLTEKPEVTQTIARTAGAVRARASRIVHPERYALSIESHQGSNGSAGLVRAIAVMRDAGRTPQETIDFLETEWNFPPRVSPPWELRDLERAVRRLFNLR